ncbi:hypothetical protein ACFWSF_22490 [Streptomyces sp. NPDC058611]
MGIALLPLGRRRNRNTFATVEEAERLLRPCHAFTMDGGTPL